MKAASINTRFPPVERSQWLDRERDSPGTAPFGRSVLQRGEAASALAPEPIPSAYLRRTRPSWRMLQRIDHPDPRQANEQACRDIEAGATGLALVFSGALNAFGRGLPADPAALDTVLAGIPLGKIHLRIDAHPMGRASVDWLAAVLAERKVDPQRVSMSFGLDPAAVLAGTGTFNMSIEALQASLPQSLAHFFAMGLPAVLLEADGRVAHNAGATEAQELGIMLAAAVAHLRMFEDARQPLMYAAPHIGFALSVDQDQFMSIIKVRALRKLWVKAQETCSIPPSRAAVHAESSYRMLSASDAEANLLRNAYAGLGAIVGGVDSLALLPAGIERGLLRAEARDMALKSQLLVARESYAAFVADPWPRVTGLDAQVAALCEAAWEEFRKIDAEGGIFQSLTAGKLQERVLQARAAKGACRHRDQLPAGLFEAAAPEADGEAPASCRPLLPALMEQYEPPSDDPETVEN
ncbi:methylmalonyl-CoA mutase family protein [Chelativorans sp. ZYF759]|uniref:methylmalonyl-CoA mutase family protein n=1 Tax=Chelativorans sp. ZYF759 TaxID=2692213 RepID=UPI001FEF6BE1|nr:methylmalonyl-CoA mutase family protein [Chelativorans sp. ZYF759]